MITLAVDGRLYRDWVSVSLTRSLDTLASQFSVSSGRISARPGGLYAGAAVRVDGPGGVMLTGYVDQVATETTADAHTMDVTGRSKSADLVDSHIEAARVWRGQSALAILRDVAGLHGLTVEVAPAAATAAAVALPRIIAEAGRPISDVIESVTRAARVVVTDSPSGSLLIYQAGARRVGELRVGSNVLSSRITVDASQVARRYVVRGQTALAGAEDVAAWSTQAAEVAEPAGLRSRVMVVLPPEGLGRADCARYAQWVADTRAAEALIVQCSAVGWDYAPGDLVRYVDPWAGVDAELIIREVTYTASATEGAECDMIMGPPVAYEPERTPATRRDPRQGVAIWADVEAYGASLPPRVEP